MAGAAQRHRIRRQVIELLAPDEDSARRIQPELSRIQRQRLQSIIEQCCSELSAPDRIHRIDLIEVDLGTIDLRDLERELPNKLKSVLRKTLAKQIEKQDSESRRRNHDPAVTSHLELLAFFAATGNLPWWADFSNPRLIPEALNALLEHAPDRLTDWLRTVVHKRDQLLRIIVHADDKTLSGLLSLLISDSPSSAAALQQQVEAILRAWSQVPGAKRVRVRDRFWVSVIRYLAVAETGATIPVRFWQQVYGEIETQSHDVFVSLTTVLLQSARSSGGFSPHLEVLLQAIAANRQGRVFVNLPADVRTELVRFLDKSPAQPTVVKHEVAPAPGSASASGETGDTQEAETPELLPASLPPETARKTRRHFRPDEDLDLDFGDADTVYIENSGLVLLWPFLPRFFERVELVEREKFKSAAAQHRAAGLLQHAVTGDPSPPEYQTTLNKVLCGLDPDGVLEFGPPVTDSESEECANLLTSVIAQAPILRDMSIDGLRGSFLLRNGLLSARDGVWLLRVERETYDVVLDRIPWSVSWVRLPWMEVPLGVEW